jgi:hypothetical protein
MPYYYSTATSVTRNMIHSMVDCNWYETEKHEGWKVMLRVHNGSSKPHYCIKRITCLENTLENTDEWCWLSAELGTDDNISFSSFSLVKPSIQANG